MLDLLFGSALCQLWLIGRHYYDWCIFSYQYCNWHRRRLFQRRESSWKRSCRRCLDCFCCPYGLAIDKRGGQERTGRLCSPRHGYCRSYHRFGVDLGASGPWLVTSTLLLHSVGCTFLHLSLRAFLPIDTLRNERSYGIGACSSTSLMVLVQLYASGTAVSRH